MLSKVETLTTPLVRQTVTIFRNCGVAARRYEAFISDVWLVAYWIPSVPGWNDAIKVGGALEQSVRALAREFSVRDTRPHLSS